MGYRLNVDKISEEDKQIKNIFYGTKLYGYKDESEFLSYIYLISIGKLTYDEFFDYSSNQFISLNKKEFTIFCYLYNIDMKKSSYNNENNYFINLEEIRKELITDVNEYDNDIYLISWM